MHSSPSPGRYVSLSDRPDRRPFPPRRHASLRVVSLLVALAAWSYAALATAQCFPTCRSGYLCDGVTCVPAAPNASPPQRFMPGTEPAQPPRTRQPMQPMQPMQPTPTLQPMQPPAAQGSRGEAPYPARLSRRPVINAPGLLSSELTFGTYRYQVATGGEEGGLGSAFSSSLRGWLSLGVAKRFEINIVPLRFRLTPDFDAQSPQLGFTIGAVLGDSFQLGISYQFVAPVQQESVFSNALSLLFQTRGDRVSFLGVLSSAVGVDLDDGEVGIVGGIYAELRSSFSDTVSMTTSLSLRLTDGEDPRLSFGMSLPITLGRRSGAALVDLVPYVSFPNFVTGDGTNFSSMSFGLQLRVFGQLWSGQ